ncbi:MAG: glycosyltransferase family 2 protein [Pseudomonadota bacterium]
MSELSAPRRIRNEIIFTWACLCATFIAVALVVWEQSGIIAAEIQQRAWGGLVLHGLFLMIIAALIYGGLLYQFTRLGYLRRRLALGPASDEELAVFFEEDAPSLTILVPSYKEDRKVVLQTLLSAALQDYPKRRVMLLIDDPPSPTALADCQQLAAARALPQDIQKMFARPLAEFVQAERGFLKRAADFQIDVSAEAARLADAWRAAAAWFAAQAEAHAVEDHTDRLFVDQILRARRDDCLRRAEAIAARSDLSLNVLARDYRRLASMFDVEIGSFERKRYVNLSHEPNKAMNLNSYIGLVGGHFRESQTEHGRLLESCAAHKAQWSVPQTDYFITLDADSLLLPDYAIRLIREMEQPAHARTAVMQTPYSAVPGAQGSLERIAGATTDIQYIIHQGFTRFNATYWVGANALIRARALQDIVTTSMERGYPVRRYIQDRTVIEDTESSVDLACVGWGLYNYPQRMAYSATPPDFGSLIIQRRRWANGGLIILPKLLRYLAKAPLARLAEGFFRVHYLISIAAVNIGLLLLLSLPFGEQISSIWLPLTALPYFVAYARDLRLCGYRLSDLFRVYALNLLLVPVNLGGVFKSLEQAITGKQIPFGRTPKIKGRTAAGALYILAAYALCLQWVFGAIITYTKGYGFLAAFALMNALFMAYAIKTFVGVGESREDLLAAWQAMQARREAKALAASQAVVDKPIASVVSVISKVDEVSEAA